MTGITAFGAYIPRLRLQRKAIVEANSWFNPGIKGLAKGERAMCNWDEDTMTMAVEAARDCLGAGEPPEDLSAIFLASTSMPYADRQNAGVLATALHCGEDMMTMDVTSSQRAGTTGLINALNSVAGQGGTALLAAAEKRRTKSAGTQELTYGDGAAAVLLGKDNVVAELVGVHQVSVDFVDHYRGANEEFDYNWEERWIRDEGYLKIAPRALEGLFKKTKVDPASIAHFVMPCLIRNVPAQLAKKAGIPDGAVRDNLQAVMGEAGTAHALVMLVDALQDAKPGDLILVVGWGQGCDAVLFKATDAIANAGKGLGVKGFLARRKEEGNYNKFLSFNHLVNQDLGLRAEADKQTALTALYRKKDQVLAMVGGKCRNCGTVQFPKSNICVNPNCGEFHSQDDHPFSNIPAKVQSWTADNLTFTPDPPQHFGMVTFEEGGRLMADFTDVDVGKVESGMPIRMVFRVKEYDPQRGFTKYFWKAAPAY
ncbi:MAG: OB-fold domain-containing protein [Alphaproteobacteria bacterium]